MNTINETSKTYALYEETKRSLCEDIKRSTHDEIKRTLHEETLALVKEERRLTGIIIENLQKISDSKLYFEMGYSSLFLYCTRALGYSEASAYRRIEAVKTIRIIPEIKEKLNSGALNLTNLAMAQSYFKNNTATIEEKRTALHKIEGQTKREAEVTLAELFEVQPPAVKEKVRHFHGEEAVLQIALPNEVIKKLDRIKALRSHKNPTMSYADVITDMCEIVIKKIDPMMRGSKSLASSAEITIKQSLQNTTSNRSCNKAGKNPRFVSAAIKSSVWQRDQGQCTFVDQKSGLRCTSTHLLQLDHDTPLFLGGETSQHNLRLLCHAHHRLREREFN